MCPKYVPSQWFKTQFSGHFRHKVTRHTEKPFFPIREKEFTMARFTGTKAVAVKIHVATQCGNIAPRPAIATEQRELLISALHARWEARQDNARRAPLVTEDEAFSPEDFPGEYEGKCW